MSIRKTSVIVTLCCGSIALVSTLVHGVAFQNADGMAKDMMPKPDMMKEPMMKAEMMMKDAASMATMHEDIMQMMAIERMAHAMAADPAFQKMHEEAMKSPAMMATSDEKMKMMMDPAAMAKMTEQVMADPEAMKMVVQHATMVDMIRLHPEMKAMMGDAMHGGMNHGESMQGGPAMGKEMK